MKPLVFIPSPRDIPEFLEAVDKIKLDKYWVKYTRPEVYAYIHAQSFFLNNREYTHLVILPDDLLVTPSDLEKLLHHAKTVKIVSGFCNIDTTDLKDYANICVKEVHAKRDKRQYTWMTFDEFTKYSDKYKEKNGLVKVQFSGFPLMVLERSVLEKVWFRNDSRCGLESNGCCLDVTFCYDAIQTGFDIYVDPLIRLTHMKIADGYYSHLNRENKPHVKLEKSLTEVI